MNQENQNHLEDTAEIAEPSRIVKILKEVGRWTPGYGIAVNPLMNPLTSTEQRSRIYELANFAYQIVTTCSIIGYGLGKLLSELK